MGPRSFDRGKQKDVVGVDGVNTASMGPRSFDRGKDVIPLGAAIPDGLQWGRDLSIAERILGVGLRHTDHRLQWGRDLSIAESLTAVA